MTKKHGLLMLRPNQLFTHPKNMRGKYPAKDVEEMANSIRSNGILHALLVVPAPKAGAWYVVSGNLRLAAAKSLGKDCPPIKCEQISDDQAKSLLTMAAANLHYDIDPISEGEHFQRIQAEQGLSVRQISVATGIYEARVTRGLRLMDLDPEIREFVRDGKLPVDSRCVDAFLSVPEKKLRIQLAKRLAANPATRISTVVSACDRLVQSLKPEKKEPSGAVATAGAGRPKGVVPVSEYREAARRVCERCNLRESSLRDAKEPAWSYVVHEVEAICGSCNLAQVKTVCRECPLTELLRKLAAPEKAHAKK